MTEDRRADEGRYEQDGQRDGRTRRTMEVVEAGRHMRPVEKRRSSREASLLKLAVKPEKATRKLMMLKEELKIRRPPQTRVWKQTW